MDSNKKLSYLDSVHRYGRIWGFTILGILFLFPVVLSLVFSVIPDFGALAKGVLAVAPMYWAVGVVEVITYVPMLGAGGAYLSFVTGNISNLKLPCALDAMEKANVKANSEEGEIISTISIAVSSIVTTAIIVLGVILMIPLTPVLASPVLFHTHRHIMFINYMPFLILALMGVDEYYLMDKEAETVPIGANRLLYLPYLMGERTPHLDPDARGVFFGLSAIHTKKDILRAVMEGVAYSLRDCFEICRCLIDSGYAAFLSAGTSAF